ncbi:hypothetical protein ANO14919_045610 [Xylariales sp. No.14919]|nr:hypothetical protein F5X98DRAFT_331894 [Xylaria grammica]GAW15152.1 hypothetical protein ANO14919_045610 [Xylariales sp. No.14919]
MKPFISLALLATGALSAQSICPFNYPVHLNSTQSDNGLVFTLASTTASTNNRALQLRPNPYLAGGFFVGLDAASPVLLANFGQAAVRSQARSLENQLYDLGPTAYLNLRDEINGTSRYTVGFANASTWPGAVEAEWYLSGGAPDGTYDLYHEEPLNIVHGFVLCTADHDLDPGPWYQLFYYTYSQTPVDFAECEYVGIRTTVAPTIYNGECDIGGITAT